MAGIKERIENSPTVWMLGTLLTGFLSGIAVYQGALKIMSLETISKDRLQMLEQSPSTQGDVNSLAQQPLPSYVDKKEVNMIFDKIRIAFNQRDNSKLYAMMGPIARAQIDEDVAEKQIKGTFDNLGKIESGFFVQSNFMGQKGLYKSYLLNYFVRYEKSKRGTVMVGILADGSSYQVYSMMFNPI